VRVLLNKLQITIGLQRQLLAASLNELQINSKTNKPAGSKIQSFPYVFVTLGSILRKGAIPGPYAE
jgi:hypothetical protein